VKSEQKHVGYISNICDFSVEYPFEIIPGFFLRRASQTERDFVSEFLKNYAGGELNPHEYRWTFTHGRGAFRLKNSEEWRYHVIDFPADFPWIRYKEKDRKNLAVSDIFFDAACISEANLRCHMVTTQVPDLRRKGPPVMWTPQQFATLHSQLIHDLEHRRCIRIVDEAALIDIARAFEQLRNLQGEHLLIRDVISRYQQSFTIHAESSLRILAQFGAIELLISHKPTSTDSGDSLSRQLRTKLPLVIKRFSRPDDSWRILCFRRKSQGQGVGHSLRSSEPHRSRRSRRGVRLRKIQ